MSDIQTLIDWVAAGFTAMAFDLVIALVILVIGWLVSSWIGSVVRRVATRSTRIDPTIVPIAYTVTIWAIRVVVLVAVLARLGVQTASIIAVLGAAGLAIALSLQGTLQNIAAGIMLLALRPFRAGDFVSVVGTVDGMVDEVGLFMTRFKQYDGTFIMVPNSNIWGSAILNLSRHQTRRAQASVFIPYGEDVNRAMDELLAMAKQHALTLDDPAPMVMVTEYRDHAMVVTVRAWAQAGNWFELQNDMNKRAQEVLRDAGIELPPSRPIK
ncbi:MAG TPA: mechanosensitive ion channel protein MscS [Pusillimonas sp.]|jgi:small-conductance mechanosensitive channel|nr:mechanosensitive ion channel protein MscS [Pusillimonas sp.]|tara:strand:+ start:22592 stop:23398 length:807 start_codon:yes stop_codon:yes gene_type:complete